MPEIERSFRSVSCFTQYTKGWQHLYEICDLLFAGRYAEGF